MEINYDRISFESWRIGRARRGRRADAALLRAGWIVAEAGPLCVELSALSNRYPSPRSVRQESTSPRFHAGRNQRDSRSPQKGRRSLPQRCRRGQKTLAGVGRAHRGVAGVSAGAGGGRAEMGKGNIPPTEVRGRVLRLNRAFAESPGFLTEESQKKALDPLAK